MTDRALSIVGPTGVTIPLSVDDDGPYAIMMPTTGLGVPPRVNRFVDSPGDGGSNRGKRYGMRPMDLPLFITGSNRADLEAKLRALDAVVDPPAGRAMLVATYSNGDVYQIPFDYVSGLEGDGSVSTLVKVEVTLSVMCTQPFWEARDPVQFSVVASTATDGLLPDLGALKMSPADGIGVVTVVNPGDVPAPITWTITGPGGPSTAVLGSVGWQFNSVLASNTNVITIAKTDRGITVTDETGANRYSGMASAPKFFDAPAGAFDVSLALTGATSNSRIAGNFRPRRKRVY